MTLFSMHHCGGRKRVSDSERQGVAVCSHLEKVELCDRRQNGLPVDRKIDPLPPLEGVEALLRVGPQLRLVREEQVERRGLVVRHPELVHHVVFPRKVRDQPVKHPQGDCALLREDVHQLLEGVILRVEVAQRGQQQVGLRVHLAGHFFFAGTFFCHPNEHE